MRWFLLLSSMMLTSCAVQLTSKAGSGQEVDNMNTGFKTLEFLCKHENIPEASAEAETLFRYARWLQKNNQLNRDESVNSQIERLYRVAAESGHYKANINLQIGAMRGHFKLRGHERLRMSQELVEAGVATGYLMIARMLQYGGGGLQQDEEMSLRFYRKAADEGSASAQVYVADMLAPLTAASYDVAQRMRECAADQGNGDAAVQVALHYQEAKDYKRTLESFQLGIAAGSESAGGFLEEGFRGPPPENELYYLAQPQDLERAERYEKIWRILANYSYANPTVPEINEIVPLPPAKLPPWDGQIQWLKDRLANVAPPKPDEWLIKKLAKEKLLDPATGRPMPGSPAFRAEYFPVDTCKSGEPCPQEGYWKVIWPERWVHNVEVVQHFNEGDLMQHPEGNYYIYRIWPLPRKLVRGPMYVKWGLLG